MRWRRQAVAAVRIAVLTALCGLAACCQLLLPLPVAAEALPDAPQPQISVPTPSTEILPGKIHGVVVDRDGTVCEGARIALEAAGAATRSTISDNVGSFAFDGVPAGTFKLTISAGGFAPQVITGLLHPGESFEAHTVALLVSTASSEVRVSASQEEIAQEQLHLEEQQRILGFIPNYFVSYAADAQPLTPRQKFQLAWKYSIDPITFLETGLLAGIEQADNSFSGFGQGAQGYAKRYAANYADNFDGTMLGSALLPVLFKQDPRYFYKGTGSKRSRVLYAIANTVICKGDNGRWQPSYSGILGSLAGSGISNLYYPAADRNGVSLTFENTGIGLAEGAVQNIFQEFVVRKLTPRIPNYNSSSHKD